MLGATQFHSLSCVPVDSRASDGHHSIYSGNGGAQAHQHSHPCSASLRRNRCLHRAEFNSLATHSLVIVLRMRSGCQICHKSSPVFYSHRSLILLAVALLAYILRSALAIGNQHHQAAVFALIFMVMCCDDGLDEEVSWRRYLFVSSRTDVIHAR